MGLSVILANVQGAVLAADSANEDCILKGTNHGYTPLNKIYSLSDKYPLACLATNATSFVNIPVKILLEDFKKYLEDKEQVADFDDVINLFEDFLRKNEPNYHLKEYFIERIKDQYYKELSELYEKYFNELEKINSEDFQKERLDEDDEFYESDNELISNALALDYDSCEQTFAEDYVEKVLKPYKEKYFSEIFGKVNDYLKDKIIEKAVTNTNYFTHEELVLTFVGYAKDSLKVQIYDYAIGLFDGNKLYYLTYSPTKESNEPSFLHTCGDNTFVNTFLHGIDYYYADNYLKEYKTRLTEKIGQIDSPSFSSSDIDKLQKMVRRKKYGELIENEVNSLIENTYYSKFINNISTLQIEDLADCAKNLIEISALKDKFSISKHNEPSETIRKPVHVAYLSKNEPLKFIKE